MLLSRARRCANGHEPEIIECDLSKAYGGDKYKRMFHVRCKDGGCCFGDYYFKRGDAVMDWNDGRLL